MGNQATALRPEVVDDLATQTEFSADEIRDYYRSFLKDTSHGRMTLSEEEFRAAYTTLFPNGDATKFANHVFKNFDKDGDGRIDFREFLSSLSIQQKGSFDEKLDWAFQLYDIDRTGTISKSEMMEMIKSFRSLKGRPIAPGLVQISADDLADYIIGKADTNNDHELNREEFMNAARTSKTLQALILGSLDATGSPFTKRKAQPKK